MRNRFQVVASKGDLPEGGQMHLDIDGEEILLCRHEGNVYAVAFYCSHEEFALEGGDMADGCITCPYHGAEFNLGDGAVLAPPAVEGIKTYPVRIEGDTIAIAPDAKE